MHPLPTPKCFHCNSDIPHDVKLSLNIQNQEENFCCIGCQTVTEMIFQEGFANFYTQRTAPPNKVNELSQEILERIKLYDSPQMQSIFVSSDPKNQNIKNTVLLLEGITCAACIWLNEQRLQRLEGIITADINYSNHKIYLTWNNEKLKLSDIMLLIEKTGYKALPFNLKQQSIRSQSHRRSALTRLWIAGLSSTQVMMLALPSYLGNPETEINSLMNYASLLLTLPVITFSSIPFYKGALHNLKTKQLGMDTPITLAIWITFATSTYATLLSSTDNVYFDSVAMFTFLILSSKYLEQKAHTKASEASNKLSQLIPTFTHLIKNNGEITETPVIQLKTGDLILVKPGETVPADGIILSGESSFNESFLSGESQPVKKLKHNPVIAGSINLLSPIKIKITKTGNQTQISHIINLLDKALSQKPKQILLGYKLASRFIASILIISVITFVIWFYFDSFSKALWIMVAVLVVTCPCALSLAMPAALIAGMNALARRGVLVLNSGTVNALHKIEHVVFDKTGTLTTGQIEVSDFELMSSDFSKYEVFSIVRLMESGSEHHIARALVDYCCTEDSFFDEDYQLKNYPSRGVEMRLNQRFFRIGNLDFMEDYIDLETRDLLSKSESQTSIYLASDLGLIGIFRINHNLRDGALDTIAKLSSWGFKLHIVSGDSESAVRSIAEKLKIENFRYGQSPEDKLNYVNSFDQKVLFVGDGINDAPVLRAAEIGMAMGQGTDIARASADMILTCESLDSISYSIQMSKRVTKIIRQNLRWGVLYNVIAIPVAAAGFLNPWIASLGMAISSLVVVGNALRLLR